MSTSAPNPSPQSHDGNKQNYLQKLKALWQWLTVGLLPDSQPSAIANLNDVKSSVHLFLLILALSCTLFFVWSIFGKLDVASIAKGEVLPSTQVKQIQHLEGGIIQEIKVTEGQHVKRGQPLVILESTASGADVKQLEINIASLQADKARLEAELNNFRQPEFPAGIENQYPNLIHNVLSLFDIRRQRYESEVVIYQKQIQQGELQQTELADKLKKLNEERGILEEQINISKDLLKDQLTNRYNHLNLLRNAKVLEGRIMETQSALEQNAVNIQERKSGLEKFQYNFHEDVSENLDKTRLQLNELAQKVQKYRDSLQRTLITSPVDGIIKQLYISTRGGVVKPGQTIMDIVPIGDELVIDAKLPVSDIGYVQVGQSVRVRLASSESRRFDNLPGTVILISPDTIVSPDTGESYYKVRIKTERNYFRRGNMEYKLYPGMQVITSIITGRRTVLSYLLDPFLNWFNESLHER